MRGTERQQIERALRESREVAGLPEAKMEDGGDEVERLLSLPARGPRTDVSPLLQSFAAPGKVRGVLIGLA